MAAEYFTAVPSRFLRLTTLFSSNIPTVREIIANYHPPSRDGMCNSIHPDGFRYCDCKPHEGDPLHFDIDGPWWDQ